jgi:hypothetical protein
MGNSGLSGLSGISGVIGSGSVVIPVGLFFTDFIGADANPLPATGSNGGTMVSGAGGFADCQRVSNRVSGTSGTSGLVISTSDNGGIFQKNQKIKGIVSSGGTIDSMGVMCRMSIASAAGYMIFLNSTTSAQFYKVADAGSPSAAAMGAAITIPALADGDSLEIQPDDGTTTVNLEAFINGISIGTRSDSSSPLVGTRGGFYFSAAAHFFKSLQVL